MGRPEVFDDKILTELKIAFSIGCTDEEACAFANVPTSTFYDYQKRHPEFSEEKERLKQNPILKAKKTIEATLDDPKNAQWYLERKKKDEFSTRSELTGKDGKDLVPSPMLGGQTKDAVPTNDSDQETA